MISMIIWVFALAGSIAAVCLTVALDAQSAHLGATAFVSFGIVAAAVNDHRAEELKGASSYNLAATASRYMGLLWAWSAISTYVVYAFLLDWPYWMPLVVAMIVACGVCLFVAQMLDREAVSSTPDAWSTVLVRVMAKAQFALGGILLGVLIAVRRQTDVSTGGTHRWVALNLVLCTAAGLLTLTGYLIMNRNAASSARAETGPAI